ncbi:MAG: TIGR04283 family arsenosugar biosynthesis glycosyltransferase [Pseudomonadota bacterium]
MTFLRIVVPVLQEAATLADTLRALQPLRARGAELVVVDGGSTDATWAIARRWADAVRFAPRGRATQMNAGAQGCDAEALLFLHADTRLPEHADALVRAALRQGGWGRFDVRIDGRPAMLKLVAAMMNRRSRLSGIATGDQAVFVRRALFEAVGGFPAQPLMEDIALSARLRRESQPVCLRERVATSGRRWEQHGVWRTIFAMWRLRAAYFFGAPARDLAARYGYSEAAPASPAAVAVMAKAPVPGLAKTRLAPLLGAVAAARAHRRFTIDILQVTRAAATGPVTLWCAPDARHRFFRALARTAGIGCRPQPAGDLGARMAHAVAAHFAAADMPLLLIGTDCPLLSPGHLHAASAALRSHDAVLIPATDGGYVLLGLRRPIAPVFEAIDWSTPRVLQQTRERLRAEGASWVELPALWDVDEPADWQRMERELGPARLPPSTAPAPPCR